MTSSIGVGRYSEIGVDDGIVVIDWSNGVRSSIEFGWWQLRLGGLEADTEVFLTDGTARIWTMPLPPPAAYADAGIS